MSLFPHVGRKQPAIRLAWWSVFALLCLGVLLHLLPFYFMISTSLKTGAETIQDPPTLWPHQVTFAAWRLLFQVTTNTMSDPSYAKVLDQPLATYLFNSLFMVLMVLLLSLPITSFAAYANSKLQRGPSAHWTFLYFIGTLMVPAVVTLLPSLLLTLNFPFAVPDGSVPTLPGASAPFPTLRFWDTPWAVIIPALFNAFNFLLFKGFFDTLPSSVLQAARVDGGSELNIFRRIVFPMSIPVYAVAAWLQFSATWDNFLWPSLAFNSPEKLPTSVAIYTLMNRFIEAGTMNTSQMQGASAALQQLSNAGVSWNGLMVLGLIQTLPIFLMFLLCREYLLRGVRIRGLK